MHHITGGPAFSESSIFSFLWNGKTGGPSSLKTGHPVQPGPVCTPHHGVQTFGDITFWWLPLPLHPTPYWHRQHRLQRINLKREGLLKCFGYLRSTSVGVVLSTKLDLSLVCVKWQKNEQCVHQQRFLLTKIQQGNIWKVTDMDIPLIRRPTLSLSPLTTKPM